MSKVRVVRIYCTEGEGRLRQTLRELHQAGVRGVTVFRGITGYGSSGRLHEASLLDLSLDLPLVIEFFDRPERIEQILPQIGATLEPGHLLAWDAFSNLEE